MKYFLLALSLACTCTSMAGDKILNGGNAVVCNPSAQNPSIELLDYYELKLNGGQLDLQGNTHIEILKNLFAKWKKVAPVRMALYEKWLNEFQGELGLYPGISIPAIPDTGSIAIPQGCSLQPIGFQRSDKDILPGVKRYVISKDLWDLMPEIQKAGLVLHELIYREGITVNHSSSFPTRYFNGYLSSAKPDSMNYATIVSNLPLEWTEYGGGMVLRTAIRNRNGSFSKCPISSEGYFDTDITCGAKEITGDVITDNFILEDSQLSGSQTYNNDISRFTFNANEFVLDLPQNVKSFGRVYVRSTDFSFDFFIKQKKCLRISMASMPLMSIMDVTPVMWLSSCAHENYTIAFNPKNTWFKTKKGILVSEINKILFDKYDGEAIEVYTVKGEVWIYDKGHDYIRKK